MGEVGDVQYAVHQRKPERNKAVNAPQRQTIDQILKQNIQVVPLLADNCYWMPQVVCYLQMFYPVTPLGFCFFAFSLLSTQAYFKRIFCQYTEPNSAVQFLSSKMELLCPISDPVTVAGQDESFHSCSCSDRHITLPV